MNICSYISPTHSHIHILTILTFSKTIIRPPLKSGVFHFIVGSTEFPYSNPSWQQEALLFSKRLQKQTWVMDSSSTVAEGLFSLRKWPLHYLTYVRRTSQTTSHHNLQTIDLACLSLRTLLYKILTAEWMHWTDKVRPP